MDTCTKTEHFNVHPASKCSFPHKTLLGTLTLVLDSCPSGWITSPSLEIPASPQ